MGTERFPKDGQFTHKFSSEKHGTTFVKGTPGEPTSNDKNYGRSGAAVRHDAPDLRTKSVKGASGAPSGSPSKSLHAPFEGEQKTGQRWPGLMDMPKSHS